MEPTAEEIEIARLICREVNGPQTADLIVAYFEMPRLSCGLMVLPGEGGSGPLWGKYLNAAKRVLAHIAETKGLTYGG